MKYRLFCLWVCFSRLENFALLKRGPPKRFQCARNDANAKSSAGASAGAGAYHWGRRRPWKILENREKKIQRNFQIISK